MRRKRQIERELLAAVEGRYFGKYRARVTENQDPENRGRLEVVVGGVLGEVPVWALPCVPYAGPDVGMYFLPDKDTHVWVEFEGGDVSYPIWTGCFWKAKELPANSSPGRRFIRTKEFTLEIDDDAGTLTIAANAGGATLTVTRNQVQVDATNEVTSTVSSRKTSLSRKNFSVNDGSLEIT